MTRLSRWLTVAAALVLLPTYILPIWRIQLIAPQYPEGIGMYIRLGTVDGMKAHDLENINQLNHYIGMRAIDPAGIPELAWMPWIVAVIVVAGLVVAAVGRRGLLAAWCAGFLTLAAAGMVDFWRWTYAFGHDIDVEHAIIKVPGAVYQPPIIGTKQILNFHAASWPDWGGVAAFVAAALAIAAVVAAFRAPAPRPRARALTRPAIAASLFLVMLLAACRHGHPETIAHDGTESCAVCGMAITDRRFSAQAVSVTGRRVHFDSIECLVAYVVGLDGAKPAQVWVSDFARGGGAVPAASAHYLAVESGGASPMGRGLVAVASAEAADSLAARWRAVPLDWRGVLARLRDTTSEHAHRVTASAAPTAPAAAQTIVVSPDGPVTSLGEALRQAAPGARIVMRTGVYTEPPVIVTIPVEIVGEGWPVLDGGGTHQIITIRADDVTVRGLVLRNVGASMTEDRAAIAISEARRCHIADNRIEDGFFGIYVARVTGCRITGNVLTGRGEGESGTGNGIHLWTATEIVIDGNRISGHRDGIYLEFSTASVARRNVSERNQRYGLHFMYSDDCRYVENVFRHNLAGVAVMYTKRVEMTGNRFEDNWGPTSYGLLLKEILEPRIIDNRFERNTIALVADGATGLVARGNVFAANGWAIKLQGSTYGGRFERNDFVGNTFDVATNARHGDNALEGNHFDGYAGYDLGRDGTGDVPHRPVRLSSIVVEKNPPTLVLLRSAFVALLDATERVFPTLTPETLVDPRPAMRPLHATRSWQ